MNLAFLGLMLAAAVIDCHANRDATGRIAMIRTELVKRILDANPRLLHPPILNKADV
jgi:hypothetical protein